MKIVTLVSENIKALKAVEITPKGDTVVISGRNAQGKTSVLDSIEYALAGGRSICDEPVRKGQESARIICNLGDIVVERTFSASGGSQLRVKARDGSPVKSPQAMLDKLTSMVAFDPLLFTRMKPMEQVETLMKLVKIDFKELNTKRQSAYDERTVIGRQLESSKAKLTEFPFFQDAPATEVNVAECQAKLEVIKKQRLENSAVRGAVATCKVRISTLTDVTAGLTLEIQRLEKRLAECRADLDAKKVALAEERDKLDAAMAQAATLTEDDETQVLAELSKLNEINSKVQANARHAKASDEVQRFQFEYDRLTHQIETIDQEKQDQLAWADFPLPGLSFDEARVLLNGVPFVQCSQAQQLQAAVAIGLALNPTIRVILIRDASLLDSDSMKLVGELAVKHDAQIWMEVVNSEDPAAVVIEAGEVKP